MSDVKLTGAPDFEGEAFFEHVWTADYDRVLSDREINGLISTGCLQMRYAFDSIRGRKIPAGKTVRVTVKIESAEPDPVYHGRALTEGETR